MHQTQKVSATEFSRNFGRYRETVHRGPLAVTSHGRITGYFISPEDYDDYSRLKKRSAKSHAAKKPPRKTPKTGAKMRTKKSRKRLNKRVGK